MFSKPFVQTRQELDHPVPIKAFLQTAAMKKKIIDLDEDMTVVQHSLLFMHRIYILLFIVFTPLVLKDPKSYMLLTSLASHTLHRERKGLVTLQPSSCPHGKT